MIQEKCDFHSSKADISVCLSTVKLCFCELAEPLPDKALTRWTEWVETRKRLFQNLAKKTHQSPQCLTENVDKQLEEILDKALIEEAQKYKVCDKYRGHPNWYATVERKKPQQKTSIRHLEYPANFKFDNDEGVMSNYHYGVPKAILEEQKSGLGCARKENINKWLTGTYLARRKKELQENINILEGFRPDIDNLYIKGKKIEPPLPEPPVPSFTIPSIEVTFAEETPSKNQFLINQLAIDKPILFIDNVPIGCDFPETDQYQWVVNFPCVEVNLVQTALSHVQNIGTSAVRYEWCKQEIERSPELPKKAETNRTLHFDFNQKRGVLLPGQTMTIEFEFSSLCAGFFQEIWRLITVPKVRSEPILFILEGFKIPNDVCRGMSWKCIENYIQQLNTKSRINEILEEIERGIFVPKLHAPYADMFGENELFEFNNPKLYYRTREVGEMKEIHQKVSDKRWNLSTLKLRNSVMEAELSCEDRNKYLDELNHLVGELLHPPKEERMERMKYNMVYTMLCAFFNQMGTVADRLLRRMSCQRLPNIDTKYPPIQFDDPFERWMINHVRIEATGTMSEKAFKKQKSRDSKGMKGRKSRSGSRKSSAGRKSAVGRKSSAGKRKSGAGGGRKSGAGGGRKSGAGGGRKSGAGGGRKSGAGGGRKSGAGGGRKSGAGGGRKSGAGRKSSAGGKRKSQAGRKKSIGGKRSRSKGSTRSHGDYIWLTDPPSKHLEKVEFFEELNRQEYRNLLEAYTKDLLTITLDKICGAVDTMNAVEAGKEFDKDVDLIAYREHYPRPVHKPQLPSLF